MTVHITPKLLVIVLVPLLILIAFVTGAVKIGSDDDIGTKDLDCHFSGGVWDWVDDECEMR